MNRYNPDYMARSIDIMKLSSKLNKVKLLPKIKRNTRQSQLINHKFKNESKNSFNNFDSKSLDKFEK